MRLAVRVLVYFFSIVAGLGGGTAFAQDQPNEQPLGLRSLDWSMGMSPVS